MSTLVRIIPKWHLPGGGSNKRRSPRECPPGPRPAQAIAIGLCGRQGSSFFTASPATSGYDSGYWLIYENAAGVGLNDGRNDHPGIFEFVYATNDNMDRTVVTFLGNGTLASTGVTPGQWVPFELTMDPAAPAGQQVVARINNATVASVSIPAGGPTSGAFQIGFRENHTGNPAAAEGTWIDGVTIRLPGQEAVSPRSWLLR